VQFPYIVQDLDEIGLRDPYKLLSSFVADERTLTDLLKGYPLNTEDHPLIEFESPRFGYDSRPLRDNQWRLFDNQVPAGDLLTNLPPDHDPRPRIWTLQQANFILFKGHSEYRLFNFTEACRLYMEALAMAPEDESIRRLLDFEELRRHYETSQERMNLNTIWVGHSLASVYLMQQRYSDAVTVAGPLLEKINTPEAMQNPELRKAMLALTLVLSEAYAGAGQAQRAAEFRQRAEELRI